ncbi:MAG: hypothetical protein ACO36I_21900, partial [Candidatus Latescibacterota bacterium]
YLRTSDLLIFFFLFCGSSLLHQIMHVHDGFQMLFILGIGLCQTFEWFVPIVVVDDPSLQPQTQTYLKEYIYHSITQSL